MRYMKKFESFSETEYNHFCGINISEIYSINFGWTNIPFFSDYTDKNGKFGDPELRMEISEIVREKLRRTTKDQLYDILSSEGLIPEIGVSGYTLDLTGQDIINFFYIIENIDEHKTK